MSYEKLLREAAASLAGACVLAFVLALVTADPADEVALTAPAHLDPANWLGWIGVWLSSTAFHWLGVGGSFALAALAFMAVTRPLVRGRGGDPAPEHSAPVSPGPSPLALAAVLGAVVAVSALERVVFGASLSESTGVFLSGRLPGGIWGTWLGGALLHAFERPVAALLAGAAVLCSGLLAFDAVVPARLAWLGGAPEAVSSGGQGRVAVVDPQASGSQVPAALAAGDAQIIVPVRAPKGYRASPAAVAEAEPAAKARKKSDAKPKRRSSRRKPLVINDPTSVVAGEPGRPPLDLLTDQVATECDEHRERALLETNGQRIERTLAQFNVKVQIRQIRKGPNISLYALELADGVKVKALENLLPNVAVALRCRGGIRVQAPIPGTSWVGLEVPNEQQDVVRLRELMESEDFDASRYSIPLILGRDSSGNPLIVDLAKLPHLLIAGTTGSGKSVCVNTIILSILLTRSPKDVKLILIDPKQVEMLPFRRVPHLLSPVVTEVPKAGAVLDWAVAQMERRYGILARVGVRHIDEFNALGEKALCERFDVDADQLDGEDGDLPSKMPRVVLIVDELADLMMAAKKEVEASIQRLAQKSRAVGIHVILATQRPSVDVVTGVLKSNLPARLAFQVASSVDSRTILDTKGAESLLGQGDMLFLMPGAMQSIRAKGTFLDDAEVERVVSYLAAQSSPRFSDELVRWEVRRGGRGKGGGLNAAGGGPGSRDALYAEAVRVVLTERRGSVSLLQRRLTVGYARASRLVDMMCEDGIVGSYKGSKAREILTTLEQWEAVHGADFPDPLPEPED